MEDVLDSGGIGGAVPGEGDGGDGGDEAGELADGVGDAGDLAAEGNGDDDGVEGSAVVADVEVAGGAGRGWRGALATDYEVDAEELVGVADYALGEWEVEVDAEDGECEAEGEPQEGDEGVQWVRALDEAAVVEDQSALQAVSGYWFC